MYRYGGVGDDIGTDLAQIFAYRTLLRTLLAERAAASTPSPLRDRRCGKHVPRAVMVDLEPAVLDETTRSRSSPARRTPPPTARAATTPSTSGRW
jgi:hypothetical protein